MLTNDEKRLVPGNGEIKVRLYGQGVGDCFLLAFPRPNGEPCYVVIDCGVAKGTPDKALRTRKIVEDLGRATGNHIDVLAITHQHYDHLSGFLDAWQEWKRIEVDVLYLPWTESTAAREEHGGVGDFRRVLEEAAKAALEDAQRRGLLDDLPALKAQADFLGLALGGDPGEDEAAGLAGELGKPGGIDDAMDFARGLARGKVRYLDPGDVFALPGTESHGYVLGPPRHDAATADRSRKRFIELLSDEKEMYSYADVGLRPDSGKPGGANSFALSEDHGMPALASALLAAGSLGRDGDEGFCPFARELRIDWDEAMASPFFRDHYGEGKGENGGWRRADFDWLGGAASLALRAGEFTNNVSLVLAFDLPGSKKMLLFPGDAQVGNWLSWHTIEDWTLRDDSRPADPPQADEDEGKTLMEDLLGRVAFYKVGHHGSHNATPRGKGLEMMQRPDLVAFIPVSVPVAQDLMGYCPMPFYPVVRALQQRTAGRVFLPNGQAVEPLPPGHTQQSLLAAAGIVASADTLPAKMKGGALLEGPVPLYLELTLKP